MIGEAFLIVATALGPVDLTSYRAVPSQTDSSPNWTSIGDRTTIFGAAVSRDLLLSGKACYGDVLIVDGYGHHIVNDVMAARHKKSVDLFVQTQSEESLVGRQKRLAWVIRSPVRACTNQEAMRMGMVNASRVRKFLRSFKEQYGREATGDELRSFMSGHGKVRAPSDIPGAKAASDNGNSRGRVD